MIGLSFVEVNIDTAGYQENKSVIQNIHFKLDAGQLIGLIGPNGAGKSTTIKAMLGLTPVRQGSMVINGKTGRYSYVPEHPILYDGLTLQEHIELAISAGHTPYDQAKEKVNKLLGMFRLKKHMHRYPTAFSKGMQQKVNLILGFIMEPDLYIVDEPFIGLDPVAIKDLLDLLELERQRGAAILMCTHVLDTAEKICDSFILMNNGAVATQGTLEEVQSYCGLPHASLFDCFYHVLQDGDEYE